MRFASPWRLEPRAQPSRLAAWGSPLLAIALTIVAGFALFAGLGKDPWHALNVFLVQPLATTRGWGEIGIKMTPLVLAAVGLAICFRANVWNIGAEGQLIVGAIAGGAVALMAGPETSRWFLVWVILAGPGALSLDALLVRLLERRAPPVEAKAAALEPAA